MKGMNIIPFFYCRLFLMMMFETVSTTLHSNNQLIKIHLVSTGAVAVKTKFRQNKYAGFAALFSFLFDKKFTEWLPIYVLVIEHPEGIFLIDAGEIAAVNDNEYFKSCGIIANWFDKTQFRFAVNREDEIDRQLQKLNISIHQVEAVILTHLHFDHSDGIKHFPNTAIIVNKKEWQKPFGDLPKLYPTWLKPQLVELNNKYDVFDKACFITTAKDIVLVETPGHTYHHSSVIIKADECTVFFAADICYSQQQFLQNKFPGNNASNKLAQTTYDEVKAFSKNKNVIFIPSHDAKAAQRLNKNILLVEPTRQV